MEKVEAHPNEPVQGGHAPILRAVLIYEDLAAGLRAKWFCENLVRILGGTLEEQMWNFEVLGIREVRNLAASAARKADFVILSLSGRAELPETICAWLDIWLWILEEEQPALVALFSSFTSPKAASIRAYLQQLARREEIDFFAQEMRIFPELTSAGQNVNLGPRRSRSVVTSVNAAEADGRGG